MKSPFPLVLLFIATFSVNATAQTRARISFDMSQDVATTRLIETPRSRGANGSNRTISAGTLEQDIFELINAERSKNGLATLVWSESVAAVARLHSQDMAKVKFFSHRGSDGSMVDERADRLGLGAWRSIGENIAYMRGFDDPAGLAVQKWLESTAHRKNLLSPNWTESAVGVAVTEDGTYYMTEVFLVRK